MLDLKDYLYSVVIDHFGRPALLDEIFWFHGTRVLPGSTFSDGILPLGVVLPQIKKVLVSVIPDTETKQKLRKVLESNGVGEYLYSLKANDSEHWGPYAMLVRDALFSPDDTHQHDYLGLPEIVADICSGFERSTRINLTSIFSEALRPAIVKFKGHSDDDEGCIASAISYVYTTIHEGGPTDSCMCCFNGEGLQVPATDIVKVEFVDVKSS
ncbi:hypothetical protein G5B88_20740 [Herbaspirillum seropedicae]|nr:hypothetical protein [Herbaspirillum seropedicae]AKN67387.1 hypothetical protein ACP92_20435 [Herbaspirillum seropedicae]NQE31979.1 hypothetical protein [Herbaspirillum seropedicae]UMU23396.1 hypothetical protein G5B88_20740 [Herbaspirillum seropedicae]